MYRNVLGPIYSVSPMMGQSTSGTLRPHWSDGIWTSLVSRTVASGYISLHRAGHLDMELLSLTPIPKQDPWWGGRALGTRSSR